MTRPTVKNEHCNVLFAVQSRARTHTYGSRAAHESRRTI